MSDQHVHDLYEILGVPRDAAEDEIKRAYRQRARELHPDAGGDEEQFKELTTAYEVLRNPQARANYDRYGDPRGMGGGRAGDPFAGFGDLSDLIDAFFGAGFGTRSAGRAGPRPGRDAIVDVAMTLEEAAAGTTRELDVTVARTCETCSGSGATPGTKVTTCGTCQGAGAVQQVTRSVFGQMLTNTTCPTCRGSGELVEQPCQACAGEGRVESTETVTVNVPPGVDDGTRLRVPGRGEAGQRGTAAGDLYVRVRMRPHPMFTRDGNDLHCEMALSMAQAAIGGELKVPTLYGDEALRIPAGVQSGTVLTLRRMGMPKLSGGGARGNLHVHCMVETPRELTHEQAELLKQFAEMRGEDLEFASPAAKGFLGRLRDAFGG